jgi:hypothetical protein
MHEFEMQPIAGRGSVDRQVFSEARFDREVRNSEALNRAAGNVAVAFKPHSAHFFGSPNNSRPKIIARSVDIGMARQ